MSQTTITGTQVRDATLNPFTKLSANAVVDISGTNIDWSVGDIFAKTISSNGTFTFSNVQPKTIVAAITNTGSFLAVWPGVKWPSATVPTLTTGAATDVFTFLSAGTNDSNVYAAVQQNF